MSRLMLIATLPLILVLAALTAVADPGTDEQPEDQPKEQPAGSKPTEPRDGAYDVLRRADTDDGQSTLLRLRTGVGNDAGRLRFKVRNRTYLWPHGLLFHLEAPGMSKFADFVCRSVDRDENLTASVGGYDADRTPNNNPVFARAETPRDRDVGIHEVFEIEMLIHDEHGAPLADTEVHLRVGFTLLRYSGQAVAATSLYGVGDGVPRKSLYSLKIPDYPNDPLICPVGTEQPVLNAIVLCEADGYRFEDGCFILQADQSASFAIGENTRVYALDEDGNAVDESDFKAENIRINSRGCLVVDIRRNGEHDKHIAMIVSGLELTGANRYRAGTELKVTMSGAAISGYHFDGMFTFIKFADAEPAADEE